MTTKIGEEIKSKRLKRGLTQSQLADNICTQATISNLENGSSVPTISILLKLAERLNVEFNSIYPVNKDGEIRGIQRYSEQEVKDHVKFLRKNYPNISSNDYSLLSKEKKYMAVATILKVYKKWTAVFPDGKLRKKNVKISDDEIHKHVNFLRDEYGYITGPNYTKLAKEKNFMSYSTIVKLYKKWPNIFPSDKRKMYIRKRTLRYSDQEVRDHVKFIRKNYPNISIDDYSIVSKEKKYMSVSTILRVYKKWAEVLPDRELNKKLSNLRNKP